MIGSPLLPGVFYKGFRGEIAPRAWWNLPVRLPRGVSQFENLDEEGPVADPQHLIPQLPAYLDQPIMLINPSP
jgi:hypothetical protein